MENNLFDQILFLRNVTLFTVKDLTAEEADLIPEGFNNNILWNLGHLCYSQEKFAFHFAGESMETPQEFAQLFAMGTKPSDWTTQPPTLAELVQLLTDQPNRIRARLTDRLDEVVPNPFTIPGLTLNTIGQLLSFNMYHEGIHVQTIRMLKKLNAIKKH